MKCPNCGNTNIQPGQKFCTKCGARLTASATNSDNHQEGQKNFIDNLTHPRTFLERGSRGVQQEVRREQQQRLQEQAARMGMEVNRPGNAQQQNQQTPNPQQPQERRLTVDTTSVEGVNVVNGRAIWNISKGEVARLITESEFANAEGLKGVIVQEGCTAIVYIDGQLVSTMQAGVYTFPAKTQAEQQLLQRARDLDAQQQQIDEQQRKLDEEQRKKDEADANTFASRGVFGEIAAAGRGVMNFLFGRKKNETADQHKRRVERTKTKLQVIPSPKLCRVYIISNRVINLIFGYEQDSTGAIRFQPMVIPTKLVDVQIGASLQLQITNITLFATNYLADKNQVTVYDLENLLADGIKNQIAQLLRNLDYQQDGLPEPVVNNLKNRLQANINDRVFGMECIKVLEITDKSEVFNRFRSVERELFASEKELGFLQRTGEFRNRLEQEQNKQAVDRATNAEQLRQALQAINKDKLISEDEMEQFVELLESQKMLRKAKTQEEEYEALQKLKKSRLVSDDDIAALQNTLAQGKITRENVTELMRIQAEQKVAVVHQIAEFELSDKKEEHDMAQQLRKAQHAGDITAAMLNVQKQKDDYAFAQQQRQQQADFEDKQRNANFDFEQQAKQQQLHQQQSQFEFNQSRQEKFDDADILAKKAAIARENMQAMKDAEFRAQQEQNRSAETIHQMDATEQMNRDNLFANMTAEQIRAAQLSHLDKDAQVAMANSYSSEKENELRAQQQKEQKELYEQMLKNQQAQGQQTQEAMLKMAQMMQNGMMGVSQNQMQQQQQMFQQQQQMQQQRYDDQVAMKQEYRENAERQQDRMDHTQDTAMNNLGQMSTAAANNVSSFKGGYQQSAPSQSIQPQVKHCPSCGAEVPEGETFCPECGSRID